jgi:hypothetical protein
LAKSGAPSPPASFTLWRDFVLFFFSALEYVAWQFDVGWLRRLLPFFLAIPWAAGGGS